MCDLEQLLNKWFVRIGEDPQREGLKDTPKRLEKLWGDLMAGYKSNPQEILQGGFDTCGCEGLVVLKNMEFYSLCEHHLLPFFGHISLGYIPNEKIVGLGAIARLVECFSRRLQIQERLSTQIADTFNQVVRPKGVAVVCSAKHLCMAMQGVQQQDSMIKTSVLRGIFKEDARTRTEFMELLRS
ncbi:GTP cyclohydrolase I FolE [Helicobacter bizzozeronii]|uniref:GTP cyclohydrolase I FolE n=1 Tax=Helicobacter bizzozeronii TaxID=56877 RepID=UPI000CF16BA2|nr:GTP cyclohydrolase I FolE [Helicobacter bizzozeronii]